MGESAVVIGAGIAGLAVACSLERLGYEVRVLERDATLADHGAGLTLWPNATRALQALGLGDVLDSCHAIGEARTLNPAGTVLTRLPLAEITGRYGPLVSAERRELLGALRQHFRGQLDFGQTASVESGGLRVGGAPLQADLIVGADGIGSVVREIVAAGVPVRPAGYGAWRAIAATAAATPTAATETIGRGKRFGMVPLSAERTYWFAVLAAGEHADLTAEFKGWHEPVGEVIASTAAHERFYLPLADLPALARWHTGRTVLIGDAAHAMTPNLGQGAAQAIEDVWALTRHLARAPIATALPAYELERKRRAEQIVARSRAVGRLAQASNPILAAARDTLARLTPNYAMRRQLTRILESDRER